MMATTTTIATGVITNICDSSVEEDNNSSNSEDSGYVGVENEGEDGGWGGG